MADSTKVIKSVNYNQHAILRDILDLHCDGKGIDLDVTYSIGNFYGHFKRIVQEKQDDGSIVDRIEEFEIPQPTYKFDVYPQVEGCEKLDPWEEWPIKDNSIDSVVIDLPFVISPMNCPSLQKENKNCLIARRFSGYYPVAELLKSYKHHIENAYRVLKDNGICIFKCQDTTTGGKELRTTFWSWLCASSVGFEVVDKFCLIAKQRLHSSKIKKQQHARKYDSVFFVFKKSSKKNIRYFDFMNENQLNEFIDGLKNNWLSKNKGKVITAQPVNVDE